MEQIATCLQGGRWLLSSSAHEIHFVRTLISDVVHLVMINELITMIGWIPYGKPLLWKSRQGMEANRKVRQFTNPA